jgi:hypothetical protein
MATCQELRIKLGELRSLKKEFDLAFKNISETKDVRGIYELVGQINKKNKEFADIWAEVVFVSFNPKSKDYHRIDYLEKEVEPKCVIDRQELLLFIRELAICEYINTADLRIMNEMVDKNGNLHKLSAGFCKPDINGEMPVFNYYAEEFEAGLIYGEIDLSYLKDSDIVFSKEAARYDGSKWKILL